MYTFRMVECKHNIGPHVDAAGPALGRQSVLKANAPPPLPCPQLKTQCWTNVEVFNVIGSGYLLQYKDERFYKKKLQPKMNVAFLRHMWRLWGLPGRTFDSRERCRLDSRWPVASSPTGVHLAYYRSLIGGAFQGQTECSLACQFKAWTPWCFNAVSDSPCRAVTPSPKPWIGVFVLPEFFFQRSSDLVTGSYLEGGGPGRG